MIIKDELNSQLDKINAQISELREERIEPWILKKMKEKLNRIGRMATKLDKEEKIEIKNRVYSAHSALRAAIEKRYLTEKLLPKKSGENDSDSKKKRL